jgi:hypothetical protein
MQCCNLVVLWNSVLRLVSNEIARCVWIGKDSDSYAHSVLWWRCVHTILLWHYWCSFVLVLRTAVASQGFQQYSTSSAVVAHGETNAVWARQQKKAVHVLSSTVYRTAATVIVEQDGESRKSLVEYSLEVLALLDQVLRSLGNQTIGCWRSDQQ